MRSLAVGSAEIAEKIFLRKSGLTWTGSTKLLSSLLRWMSANELDTTALNP